MSSWNSQIDKGETSPTKGARVSRGGGTTQGLLQSVEDQVMEDSKGSNKVDLPKEDPKGNHKEDNKDGSKVDLAREDIKGNKRENKAKEEN